jgi:hypothetical protein
MLENQRSSPKSLQDFACARSALQPGCPLEQPHPSQICRFSGRETEFLHLDALSHVASVSQCDPARRQWAGSTLNRPRYFYRDGLCAGQSSRFWKWQACDEVGAISITHLV